MRPSLGSYLRVVLRLSPDSREVLKEVLVAYGKPYGKLDGNLNAMNLF